MSYPEATTKAAIVLKAKLSEKYKITNLGRSRHFLSIEIYRDENGTGISLSQKSYITTILKRFGMEHSHTVSTPIDPNIKLDLAEDRGREGIGRYRRLSSSCGITNVRSTCNSPGYLVYGRWSFSIQFAAIHQPYDR
jgi:hypothetical protein